MENNKLIRYKSDELERVRNSIAITNKLLIVDRGNLFEFFDFFPITTIYCDMSETQRNYYSILTESCKSNIVGQIRSKGLKASRAEIVRSIHELRMACYGTSSMEESTDIKANSIKSFILLKELIRLKDSKVFIVSPFVKVLDYLAVLLSTHGLQYRQLDGRAENRNEVVSTFNNPASNCNILIASQNVIHGININMDYIFILNPTGLIGELVDIITRDRMFRRKERHTVYALISRNTIEEKLIGLQKNVSETKNYIDLLSVENLNQLFD